MADLWYMWINKVARGQDGWILAEFSFGVFMDRDEVEVHKNAKRELGFVSVHNHAKRELGQYPAILTKLAWSIKGLLYGIKSTEKMIFVLAYFRAVKRKPVICKSDNVFRFSRFLVPSRQRNHRKSFYCHEKYFAKENFCAATWTWTVSLPLAYSGGQSQRGIWFTLPARRACRIIKQ